MQPRGSGSRSACSASGSIRDLYQAARPTHSSGHGYRIGGSAVPPAQTLLSHWGVGLRSEAADLLPAQRHSPHTDDYSLTLQEARQRILSASQTAPAESGWARAAHLRRALQMTVGEVEGPKRLEGRPSRGGPRNSTPDGDDDDEPTVSAVEFSLLCPYSRLPMRHPVRSRDCRHVQCCDLESWLVLMSKCKSLRDPTGPCPVCERRVAVSTLEVDLWMASVLASMPPGTHLVVLHADGNCVSGDASRERRRDQQVMEVIENTQADDVNYLDDMGEMVAVRASAASVMTDKPESTKWMRSPPSLRGDPSSAQQPFSVKQESKLGSPPVSQASADEAVLVVRYVEGRPARVLPSQARLWVPHCPLCRSAILKDESGHLGDRCPRCQDSGLHEWTLVRTFSASSTVQMELTADDTVLLSGVDAAAPYLYRAGFQRTAFAPEEFLLAAERPIGYRPSVGVWASSIGLTRFDLDFLEACCDRIARGEDLVEMNALPALFRISQRRRVTVEGSPMSQSAVATAPQQGGGQRSAVADFFSHCPQRAQPLL